MSKNKHFQIVLLLMDYFLINCAKQSDLGLFLSTGIIAPSAFSESFEHKLGLKRKKDMVKTFAKTQSTKTGLTGIYF